MAIKVEIEESVKAYLRENTYGNTGIRFALCTLIKDKEVKALTDFVGCRDAFISYMSDHFNEPEKQKLEGLSTRKTAVLAQVSHGKPEKPVSNTWYKGTYGAWLEDCVSSGVNIINYFEKESKWALSKSYDTDVPKNLGICVQLIQGSRWWISSPYTFSLFLLLIRSACRYEVIYKLGQDKELTTDKIVKAFEKINDDYLYNKEHIWKWPLLLKHRRELFKGYTTADNYKEAHRHGADGIKRFTDGSLLNEDLRIRFEKICQNNN